MGFFRSNLPPTFLVFHTSFTVRHLYLWKKTARYLLLRKQEGPRLLIVVVMAKIKISVKIKIFKKIPLVLYECDTLSLTLREEYELKISENKMLKKIGPKRDEIIRG
jgi:hypothetical protein